MRTCSLPLALVALAPAFADAPPAATLVAEPAVVSVQPIAAGQRLISLPALDYTITVVAECGEPLAPESVSISIADTTVSLGPEALAETPVSVRLTVPGEQVAPVAVEGFCAAAEVPPDEIRQTRIDDAVTAHLSLRCADEQHQTMLYASRPLGVRIECARDQAPSESSAAR